MMSISSLLSLSIIGSLGALGLTLLSRSEPVLKSLQWVFAFFTGLGAIASVQFLLSGESVVLPYSFVLDSLSGFFLLLVQVIATLVSVFGISYIQKEVNKYPMRTVFLLTMIFILGMQGVLLSGTFLSFLIAWEVMSLASFFLVWIDGEESARKAGLFYLVMTHIGAGALLLAFSLLSGGALHASLLLDATELGALTPSLRVGALALLFFGFASKAGLFPFQVWLPDAHPAAPSHVSALMSGLMLKIAIYGILRFFLPSLAFLSLHWAYLFLALGLISAIYGVLKAVLSHDMKRMLAYSSIENVGLIFIMIGTVILGSVKNMPLLTDIGMLAVFFHILSHALFKSGLFMSAGVIIANTHTRNMDELGGLAQRMPCFSKGVLALSLAAAALPPFGAFISEWLLIQFSLTALASSSILVKGILIFLVSVVALISGVAIFTMVKFFGISFLAEPRTSSASKVKEPSIVMSAPIILSALLVLAVGVCAPLIAPLFPHLGTSLFTANSFTTLTIEKASLYPSLLVLILGGLYILTVVVKRIMSGVHERMYHTWDCGQPIDATMEYTGTAFSAPLRFVFKILLRIRKSITSSPVNPKNPWIRQYTIKIVRDHSVISVDFVYDSIAYIFQLFSRIAGKIHNGLVQFYIALIFIALLTTIFIAL